MGVLHKDNPLRCSKSSFICAGMPVKFGPLVSRLCVSRHCAAVSISSSAPFVPVPFRQRLRQRFIALFQFKPQRVDHAGRAHLFAPPPSGGMAACLTYRQGPGRYRRRGRKPRRPWCGHSPYSLEARGHKRRGSSACMAGPHLRPVHFFVLSKIKRFLLR